MRVTAGNSMNDSSTTSAAGESSVDTSASKLPPDWEHVPFAVSCPRCGRDLFGHTEARCPQCALAFDWSEVVPIEELTCLTCGYHLYGLSETRCPECGNDFDWDSVLLDYRTRQRPFFEYRYRRNPIRSLIRSWWLAIQPWRLWRIAELHDGRRTKVLLLLLALTIVGAILIIYGSTLAMRTLGSPLFAMAGFPATANILAGWAIPRLPESVLHHFTFLVPAFLFEFLVLMTLRQSMRQCRALSSHVVRVAVYAAIPSLLVSPVVTPAIVALGAALGVIATQHTILQIPFFPIPLGLMIHFISISLGYRLYLRMRHAWAVGLAATVILVLSAMLIGSIKTAFNL